MRTSLILTDRVRCVLHCYRTFALLVFPALLLLPVAAKMASAASGPGHHETSSTTAIGAKSPAHTAARGGPVKEASTHLSLAGKIAAQPMQFFPVADQKDGARYVAHGVGYALTLGDASLTLTSERRLKPEADIAVRQSAADGGKNLRNVVPSRVEVESAQVEFVGANRSARVEGLEPASSYANFMIGNDASKWRSHVQGYQRVRSSNLYPGIDLVYHGELHQKLEYDLAVAPGADPQQIHLRVTSGHEARIGEEGDLELNGPEGMIRLDRPVLYQNIPGGKKVVAGGFVQLARNEFGFRIGDYDASRPLIIDPTINLLYSTFVGGIHDEAAFDLTLDSSGNVYLAGWSASQDFPVTANGLQQVRKNIGSYVYDAVIMKFDASGNVLFSTFLGGAQNDHADGIRVDQSGRVILTGLTQSSDFPVTSNAYQKIWGGGSDVFFSVISNDGSQLLYSTYLGGAGDEGAGKLESDASGAFWIGGSASASGLPATSGAYQTTAKGNDNVFVARVEYKPADAQPLKIDALTFLGGSHNGEENSIADMQFDSAGNVYVTGASNSTDFPTTANAYQKASDFTLSGGCYNSPNPNELIFVSELSADLKTLVYSSALGGKIEDQNGYPVCNQFGRTIHPDNKGNIWVAGTVGMQDFPTTANALSRQLNGNGYAGVDDFIVELTPGTTSTALTYGSYLGGSQFDYGSSAIWDANENIWIISNTQSTDWPGVKEGTSLQAANAGGYDMTITELQPDATKILYATYLGGSGDEDANYGRSVFKMDANANLYMAGGTGSRNFPTTATAFQATFANGEPNPDGYDIYYAVLGTGTIGTVGPAVGGNTGDTSITIGGSGYQSGATCELVQGSTTIASVTATVNAAGTAVTCAFPLSGAATGSYDVVVKNPDGSTFTKAGGFTVESGGQPDLTVSLVGRPIVRTGYPSTFFMNVTNSGNEDAYMVPLWVTLPVGLTYSINGYSESYSAFLARKDGTTNYVNLILPKVAPGQTLAIPLQITSASDSPGIALSATLQPPWFSSVEEVSAAASATTYAPGCAASSNNAYALNCFGPYLTANATGVRFFKPSPAALRVNQNPLDASLQRPRPLDGSGCTPPSAYDKGEKAGYDDAKNKTTPKTPNPYWLIDLGNWSNWQTGYAMGQYNQALGQPAPSAVRGRLSRSSAGPDQVIAHPLDGETCTNPPKDPPKNLPPAAGSTPPSGGSIDPNFKSGSTGDNSVSAYVRGTSGLTYSVGFENEATALLPAAQVVVTDQLDPTKVDLSTLALGTISFGTNVIGLPSGASNYSTTYSLSSSLAVRIQGSLNVSNGLLKWTFTSIDPSTGLPPTDATVGFLPPDTDGVKGQGVVQFTVMPLAGQKTGAKITNGASIVFDSNAAIKTPVWLNTLDVDAPVSSVTALPVAVTTSAAAATFLVSWSGTDKGSGVSTYTIYVSDNGGAFLAWQTGVAATSASYTGAVGHTYGFYSIAADGAGNAEVLKASADTTTTVAPPAPLATTTTLTTSATSISVGGSVTLTAVVAPPAGSGTVPTGTVTFSSGTTVLGTGTLDGTGTAAYTTTALPIGTNSVTAGYGGSTVFAASTSTAVSVVVHAPSFALSLSPASVTVASGSSGSAMVTATPAFGFTAAISFTCSGLPAHSTCSFSPSTVTPAAGTAGTTTLTISTGVTSNANFKVTQGLGGSIAAGILFTLILLPWGIKMLGGRRRWSGLNGLFLLLLAGVMLVAVSACGSSGSSNKTPVGTSTVTVTGTAGSTSATTTFQLTVQ